MNPTQPTKTPPKSLPERNFDEFMRWVNTKAQLTPEIESIVRCAYFVSAKSVMMNLEFLETKVPRNHRRRLKIHYGNEIAAASQPYTVKPETN